jgi:magnesium transporter
MRRPRLFSISRRSAPGAAPGTLIPPTDSAQPVIDVFAFTKDECAEFDDVDPEDLRDLRARAGVKWVNVSGLGDTASITRIAQTFSLHQLAMEDVLNLHQRPKVEEFEDHLFIIVRMVAREGTGDTEQVSIFLGEDFILSIQEKFGDCFDPVRARIRDRSSRLRTHSADYLAYALIDSVVDGYFPLLEALGERLEQLEEAIVRNPRQDSVSSLHDLKRRLISLRRAVWPSRDLLSALSRDEHDLLQPNTRMYLRDCYDHTVQLMDLIETYRETASGLMDVYISSVSARLGEVMKVLTIIATIFIPLSFIAALYGMNFDRSSSPWNMPELGWRLGYPFALALMALCAGGMVVYFWRSGWLGDGSRVDADREERAEK